MREIKSIQVEKWSITYTKDVIQIGCQRHSLEEWLAFDDTRISQMGSSALEWANKWRDTIIAIIEKSPAL